MPRWLPWVLTQEVHLAAGTPDISGPRLAKDKSSGKLGLARSRELRTPLSRPLPGATQFPIVIFAETGLSDAPARKSSAQAPPAPLKRPLSFFYFEKRINCNVSSK